MAITVSEPTALRDATTSYFVAIDNPVIFTFTATASPPETQVQLIVYNASVSPAVAVNTFDIILSFDSNNQVAFDVAPYLRSLLNNTNGFNYSGTSSDTNASIQFYIDYAEAPAASPGVYVNTQTFTAVKAAKQIGDIYGANMADYVDFNGQTSVSLLSTPVKTLPYWAGYPFSIEGILNIVPNEAALEEYNEGTLQTTTTTAVTPNELMNHFAVAPASVEYDKLLFYLSGNFVYRDGNAKVYDGSFDYDTLPFSSDIQPDQAISYLWEFDLQTTGVFQILFDVSTIASSADDRVYFYIDASNYITLFYNKGSGDRMTVRSNVALSTGYNNVIITYDGSTNGSGVSIYQDGVSVATVITNDTLTTGNFSYNTNISRIGASSLSVQFLNANLKQFEILNFEADATQAADAATSASFRGAGIAHESGNYFLAVDFDRSNGQAPIVFQDTPSYIITSFGGATYVDYE